MKTGTALGLILLAAASVAGAVWMFRSEPLPIVKHEDKSTSEKAATKEKEQPAKRPRTGKYSGEISDEECPPLPASGEPAPKLVADSYEYDFGTMEVLQQKSHKFVLRNEGTGPLLLKQGVPTCKCTSSSVTDKPIAPGKSVEVTLTWKPVAQGIGWSQYAPFCTNDPDPQRRKIKLLVKGNVLERITIVPREVWPLGDVIEGQSAEAHGRIFSMTLDKFKILKVEAPNSKFIKGSWEPISEAELKTHKAKSGYLVKVQALPGVPAGSFSYEVDIATDIPDTGDDAKKEEKLTKEKKLTTLKVEVSGSRSGPFTFATGTGWRPDKNAIVLGRLKALEKNRTTLRLFVRKCPPEGLKLLSQKCEGCESKPLVASLEADGSPSERLRRYKFHIDYAAGRDTNPRDEMSGLVTGRIRLKTNHPDARDFDVLVYYQPY